MHRQNRPRDSLIALFLLGAFLLSPPFLMVFDTPERIVGVPVLYAWLFLAWAVLIGLVALAARRLVAAPQEAQAPHENREDIRDPQREPPSRRNGDPGDA